RPENGCVELALMDRDRLHIPAHELAEHELQWHEQKAPDAPNRPRAMHVGQIAGDAGEAFSCKPPSQTRRLAASTSDGVAGRGSGLDLGAEPRENARDLDVAHRPSLSPCDSPRRVSSSASRWARIRFSSDSFEI